MVARIFSAGLSGIDGYIVTVECFLSGGLPRLDVVGLPTGAVSEAGERVRAAEAVGRVMATAAVTCPPAVPIAVMGELISARQAELMAAYGIEYVDVVR